LATSVWRPGARGCHGFLCSFFFVFGCDRCYTTSHRRRYSHSRGGACFCVVLFYDLQRAADVNLHDVFEHRRTDLLKGRTHCNGLAEDRPDRRRKVWHEADNAQGPEE
jgi:hypothetical protein